MKKNNKKTFIFFEIMNWKRYMFVLLTILFSLILFLVYHRHKSQPEIKMDLMVTTPWTEKLKIEHDYVAQIRSIEHIAIRSLEKGYLEHIYVDEGNFVKKGTILFQVMPVILRAERDKAKAEYQIAKIEYENSQMLAAKNVVSSNALALSKAKLDEGLAKMQLADLHLQFTTIKAPFDGIVGRFKVRLGSLLEEGQILTTMSDNSVMWVYFNVTEADYLNLMHKHENDKKIAVKLLLANGQYFVHEGWIDTIEADFNNQTGNIAFRASFPNPDNLLRHGQTGNVILTEWLSNALVIPQKTVFEVLDKKYVYVVDEKNAVVPREIVVGYEIPNLFIVKHGLSKTDKILLEGLGKVHSGQTVNPNILSTVEVKASLNLPVA